MDKTYKSQKLKFIRKLGIVRKTSRILQLASPFMCYRLRNIVTVKLMGQLGNQLFQYACGYAMAKRNHLRLRVLRNMDDLFQLRHFNIQAELDRYSPFIRLFCKLPFFSRLTNGVSRRYIRDYCKFHFLSPLIENRSMDFEPRLLKPQRPTRLWMCGFWQDERYFADCTADIRTQLQITTPASPQTEQLLNEITQRCAVSIHIRRKDYVGSYVYTQLTPLYYQRACEYVAKHCGSEPTFYVFSDDPAWVAQHFLPQFAPQRDIHVASDADISEIDDLRAMSACRHHIIANSTFSWWGAWLNPSEDKIVVSPYRWFNADSYLNELSLPSGWIRL